MTDTPYEFNNKQPDTLDGEPLKPTYEQLESLYFAQCECTDEWVRKYEQSQADKVELVRQCAEICDKASSTLGIDLQFDKGFQYGCKKIKTEILSLLPKDTK
jgi:hypothetical protein